MQIRLVLYVIPLHLIVQENYANGNKKVPDMWGVTTAPNLPLLGFVRVCSVWLTRKNIYLATFKRRGKTTLSHSKRGIKPVFRAIESSVGIAIRFYQARFNTVYELG